MPRRRTFAAGLQPSAFSEASALRRAPIRRRRIGRCLRWPPTPAPGARATPRSTRSVYKKPRAEARGLRV